MERRDALQRFRFVDSGEPVTGEPCPVPREELDRAVWVRLADGALVSGYDAVLAALTVLPRWRLLAVVGGQPPLRLVGAMLYWVFAKHRHRSRWR